MDLLELEGSSDDSDDSCVSNTSKASQVEKSCQLPAAKKRKQGCVSIILSSQAPASLFARSVPHKRGHWSGHVMVMIQFSSKMVERSILKFQRQLEKQGFSGTIIRHEQIHLSLSKYFSLQLGFIESFVKQLEVRLQHERSIRVPVDHNRGIVLVNEENTRSFWGWRVLQNATLTRLVQHVDVVLKSYNQPSYYDPPIFHISLASFPGNVLDVLEEEDDDDDSSDDDDNECDYIHIDSIQCKFGTIKSFIIDLQP